MKKVVRLITLLIITALVIPILPATDAQATVYYSGNGIKNNGTYGITIDIYSPVYTETATDPINSTWRQYAYGNQGCAWFASARLYELMNSSQRTIRAGSNWISNYTVVQGLTAGSAISQKYKCLICLTSHVAVVEDYLPDTGAYIISEGGAWDSANNHYCSIKSYKSLSYYLSYNKLSGILGYVYLPIEMPHGTAASGGSSGTGGSTDVCAPYGCSAANGSGTYICTSKDGLVINRDHNYSSPTGTEIPYGATVTVTKMASNGTYAHVEYNGVTGIASRNFLQKVQTLSDECNTYNCVTDAAGWYKVTSGDGLDLHNAHNYYDSSAIYTLPANAIVYLSKKSTTTSYAHVTYGNLEGVCSANYLRKLDSYTVTLNTNGGSGSRASVQVWKDVSANNNLSDCLPERTGYVFDGWYTSAYGGTKVYDSEGVCTNEGTYWSGSTWQYAGNAALYAHWTQVVFPVTGLVLSETGLLLTPGETFLLSAEALPDNATNKSVRWQSSDPSIAAVSEAGLVTAKKEGIARVTVSAEDGSGASTFCTVQVYSIPVTGIELDRDHVVLDVGSATYLTAIFTPEDATDKSVAWYSSNEDIVTVDENGRIRAAEPGSAVIYAYAEGAEDILYADCHVQVREPFTDFELDRYVIDLALDGIGRRMTIRTNASEEYINDIIWESLDSSVATVTEDGTIIAQNAGSTRISASLPGAVSVECIVYVNETFNTLKLPYSAEQIGEEAFAGCDAQRVLLSSETRNVGSRAFADSGSLLFVLIPDSVEWIADDAFAGSGKPVLVCSEGSYALAYAIRNHFDYLIDEEASFIPVRSIEMEGEREMEIGDTFIMSASVYPETASNRGLIWTSDNPDIAEITEDGILYACEPGTCRITARAADGSGVSASCRLTVVPLSARVDTVYNVNHASETADLTAQLSITGVSIEKVQTVTLYLYDSGKNIIGSESVIAETADSGNYTVSMNCVNLQPATLYYARAAAVIAGISVPGDWTEFTTDAAPTRIRLNSDRLRLGLNDTFTLESTVLYATGSRNDVLWRSSSTGVAAVSGGVVTAVGVGTAIITAYLAQDPTVRTTCTVTVFESIVPVTGVTLSSSTLTLQIGESGILTVSVQPDNATNQDLRWYSSDSSIAAISDGVVTAIGVGSATIRVSTDDGSGAQASCTVTVNPRPVSVTGVTVDAATVSIDTGATYSISSRVQPENASNKQLLYSSSNPAAAAVSSGGVVTGMGRGLATITITAADGSGASASFQVAVNDPCNCSTIYAGYYTVNQTSTGDLAINDGHGYKPESGFHELAVIPSGARVYISKATGAAGTGGCWGHVSYNGYEGFCSMFYLTKVVEVNSTVNAQKLSAVLAQADVYANYVWTSTEDIPVYNNLYNYKNASTNPYYGNKYYYKAGTNIYGVPYTLNGNGRAKYWLSKYQALSESSKAEEASYIWSGASFWSNAYGMDCMCMVNDCLYHGDSAIPHDGQMRVSTDTYFTAITDWNELAPGDALVISNHAMLVYAVNGNTVTIVEQRGRPTDVVCPNATVRPQGGYYVCGTCEYCKGRYKTGTIKRTVSKASLQSDGYTIERYKYLYTDS